MRFSLFCLPLVILCACGPKDPADTDDSATSADSDATTVDATTTADTGTAEPPTTSETPTTSGDACEDPTVPVGPAVEIQIHNTGAARAFVDAESGCEEVSPFTILGADNSEQKVDFDAFEWPCSEIVDDDACGEPLGCPVAGWVIQIEPGATLKLPWSGGSFVKAPLAQACADERFCGGCFISEQAPAGAYKVQVRHAATTDNCEGTCPVCTPNADGWCIAEGVRVEDSLAEATINYPTDAVVELVIP